MYLVKMYSLRHVVVVINFFNSYDFCPILYIAALFRVPLSVTPLVVSNVTLYSLVKANRKSSYKIIPHQNSKKLISTTMCINEYYLTKYIVQ
jgi:hypothetical protein